MKSKPLGILRPKLKPIIRFQVDGVKLNVAKSETQTGHAYIRTKILGHPNLGIMFSYMKVAAWTAVSVFMAFASAHFVKYSVATTMYAIPLEELG